MVQALSEDPDGAELSSRERAIVNYSLKLTRTPASMTQDDMQPLRDAGLDDRTILDLAMIVAYYAYVNRLASGLGVELEDGGPPHVTRD